MDHKVDFKARHQSRKFLTQALYQWEISRDDLNEILLQFVVDMSPKRNDVPYFQDTFLKVIAEVDDLDALYRPFLDRKSDEVGPIEKAVLRLGAYELKYRIEIPYKVVLNEAIEMAKLFGPDKSYQYINAVLDKLAPELRSLEI